MPRYKLTIEYDGRPFVGWQVQDNGISVQGVLTAALAAFCSETVHVQGAGRTDAGVHALGQVAHVDLTKAWDADTVRDALNACLRPHPVAVLTAEDFAATAAEDSHCEGIIDHLRALAGVKVALLIRELAGEHGGQRKVSLRATDNEVDVSVIARAHGGGGHRRAAGFTSELPTTELIDAIRAQV